MFALYGQGGLSVDDEHRAAAGHELLDRGEGVGAAGQVVRGDLRAAQATGRPVASPMTMRLIRLRSSLMEAVVYDAPGSFTIKVVECWEK
jgi:hypothetical protein